jgi:hypothetical protein
VFGKFTSKPTTGDSFDIVDKLKSTRAFLNTEYKLETAGRKITAETLSPRKEIHTPILLVDMSNGKPFS